jgi:hypothetical protein
LFRQVVEACRDSPNCNETTDLYCLREEKVWGRGVAKI